MPSRVRIGIATLIVAAVATTAAALWLMWTYDGYIESTWWYLNLATNVFMVGVGLVAWSVRPSNRVGPLLALAGLASMMPWLTMSNHDIVWTIGEAWEFLGLVIIAHVYLAFPEGRTRGWSRLLAIATYAWFFVSTAILTASEEYPVEWPWPNPFMLWPDASVHEFVGLVSNIGAVLLTILVVATVIEKWRRGSSAARRALAPVFWVSPVTLLVVGALFIGQATGDLELSDAPYTPLGQLSFVLLPAAFLVGLLRTRLDQASIADLVRDLDDVGPDELERALAEAVRDPTLRVAFPSPEGEGYVDASGQAVALPAGDASRASTRIGAGDAPLAILLHDGAIDPDLIAAAAAASGLALENARLTAELRAQLEAVRASRLRIVEAADEERRRLERDLHDGAQQRLVALGFALRDAGRRAGADPHLADVLEAAREELEAGLRELRAIARGLHPSALDDGLGPAIAELADRSPVPVEVELEAVALPGPLASTAYFIVAEALTNALRHAGASRIVVRGAARDGHYRLLVSDDGRGGAAGTSDGSGMRGLHDRAAALGGTLRVESPPGGGTTLVAELPLP